MEFELTVLVNPCMLLLYFFYSVMGMLSYSLIFDFFGMFYYYSSVFWYFFYFCFVTITEYSKTWLSDPLHIMSLSLKHLLIFGPVFTFLAIYLLYNEITAIFCLFGLKVFLILRVDCINKTLLSDLYFD